MVSSWTAKSFCAEISVPIICRYLVHFYKVMGAADEEPTFQSLILRGRQACKALFLDIAKFCILLLWGKWYYLWKRKHNHLAVRRPFGKARYNNKEEHPMQWIGFWNTFPHPRNLKHTWHNCCLWIKWNMVQDKQKKFSFLKLKAASDYFSPLFWCFLGEAAYCLCRFGVAGPV